uniref:Uncharacterized protein n=1 Tax=Corticoviridae sp. TaxID=2832474 RepID=A0A8D9UHC8_9VIRU|nr:MAG TPA: hypothetical protein [Corticoviridae sp.]
MSAIELIQLATSTGVLAGGLGIAKWAFGIERRLMKIEVLNSMKG